MDWDGVGRGVGPSTPGQWTDDDSGTAIVQGRGVGSEVSEVPLEVDEMVPRS